MFPPVQAAHRGVSRVWEQQAARVENGRNFSRSEPPSDEARKIFRRG